MKETVRKKTVEAMFDLFPKGRKLIYEAFDKLDDKLTRTQQMILLALNCEDRLSMSQLADRICTSNEQATRAVASLVDNGYVTREQNKQNRRVVNISLTDKAKDYIDKGKKNVLADTQSNVKRLSDEDLESIRSAVNTLLKLYKA